MYNRYVMNRHEYRVKLVFALYQSLLLNKEISRSVEDNFDDEEKNEYVTVLENDLIINKDNYIKEISLHLKKWTFDEAIRIAKMYCDEKSYQYINGVLDNL